MQLSTSAVIPYFGNGPYCYSNATSMLLSSIGEQIPPAEIEVYTGVGLGAFWLPKEKLIFFSSVANPPDVGISRALRLLGFDYSEKASDDSRLPPFEQLRGDLVKSAAILGPLDMGYLSHNPLHKRMAGADHFVLAYAMDDDGVSIHDPEGFPSVHLQFRQLEPAWRADAIGYRRGYYRYWTNPRRVRRIGKDELYDAALSSFKEVYDQAEKLASSGKWTIDREAILTFTRHLTGGKVTPPERGFMVHFSFKLGARRAWTSPASFHREIPSLHSSRRAKLSFSANAKLLL